MSVGGKSSALTPLRAAESKGGTPLVCLTTYATPMARLVDAHCDLVLVGDSVGMVLHGFREPQLPAAERVFGNKREAAEQGGAA